MSITLQTIALGPNAVHDALALVETIAGSISIDLRERLAVVVEELVINLVDHADACGRVISLSLEPVATNVRLVLIDDAEPFDPRIAPEPSDLPNEERGGGAGLAIVRAWSHILSYERIKGQNRLELIVLPSR